MRHGEGWGRGELGVGGGGGERGLREEEGRESAALGSCVPPPIPTRPSAGSGWVIFRRSLPQFKSCSCIIFI